MMEGKSGTRWKRAGFIFVLLFVFATTVGVFLISRCHKTLFHEPCIENGVLDLAGWDPRESPVIHLDGEWEFYWDRWIVSEKTTDTVRDALVPVPEKWSHYRVDGRALPNTGIASYRIRVINCPEEVNCVAYVPNLQNDYRLYFNDSLATSRGDDRDGDVRRDIGPEAATRPYMAIYSCSNLPREPEFDLTIELSGDNLDGLVLTPVLTENRQEYLNSSFRYALASAYFGVMLTSLVILAFILYGSFRGMKSLFLYLFNLLMFLRVLLKDEFFGLLQIFLPFHNYYLFSNILKVLTLLLPFVFFFYIGGILDFSIKKDKIVKFLSYELLILICICVCLKLGLTKEEFFFSLLSLVPFIPMLFFLYRNMMEGKKGTLTASLCLMFLIGSLVTGSLYRSGLIVINISMIPPTFFLAFIVTQDYIFIHKIMDRHKEVLESATLRLQLEEKQTALMLSQIKPHFLYNALVAIQVLCGKDPKKAQVAIFNFSQYLRANMSSISSSVPIPFEQELNHIRNYTAIEKLRFQNRLNVHYEILTTDFKVPSLTIEPLVENAIKHGATKNVEGGNVWLSTRETPDAYVVKVKDDGPGFDVSTLDGPETDAHGLKNIIFRLKQMPDVDIMFESHTDRGTEVTVTVPKTGES